MDINRIRKGNNPEIAGKIVKNAYYGDSKLTGYAIRRHGQLMLETIQNGEKGFGLAYMLVGQYNAQ